MFRKADKFRQFFLLLRQIVRSGEALIVCYSSILLKYMKVYRQSA